MIRNQRPQMVPMWRKPFLKSNKLSISVNFSPEPHHHPGPVVLRMFLFHHQDHSHVDLERHPPEFCYIPTIHSVTHNYTWLKIFSEVLFLMLGIWKWDIERSHLFHRKKLSICDVSKRNRSSMKNSVLHLLCQPTCKDQVPSEPMLSTLLVQAAATLC